MCGISCILQKNESCMHDLPICQGCTSSERLHQRGPDHSKEEIVDISVDTKLILTGHVLHLRGELTPQPLSNDKGDQLLWNGEIFGGIQVKEEENDTQILLDLLAKSHEPQHILDTLGKIEGPWSFVYFQNATKQLWFGRDVFGRRSLLWHLPDSDEDPFVLSSVQTCQKDFNEVPSVGIFCISLSDTENCYLHTRLYTRNGAVWPGTKDKVDHHSLPVMIYPNYPISSKVTFEIDDNLHVPGGIPKLNCLVPDIKVQEEKAENHKRYIEEMLTSSDSFMSKLADQLIDVLLQAVKRRVYNQTYLKQRNCNESIHSLAGSDNLNSLPTNMGEKISDSSDLASRTSKLAACTELKETPHNQQLNVPHAEGKTPSSRNEDSVMEQNSHINFTNSKIAILFSGGIDSAVIAALVDRCLPESESVDLINVAFEQQPKGTVKTKRYVSVEKSEEDRWKVPDRETGHNALAELNSNRTWNFVEVNVTLSELKQIRSSDIRHLVYPLETVLDDSIGSAVWFAARGHGILGNGMHAGEPCISKAKVILCGMGADEQFAGYSRHRGKYQENGWVGLLEEIQMEILRISARNLGRDDRVITDHGKESRFPFLDENVVAFLQNLPVHHKANLNLPRGLGEKLLLRLAATKCGLINTAVFPKRAIQFGSRIAKIENSKEKANDKCTRLAE